MILVNNIKLSLDDRKEKAIEKALSILSLKSADAFLYKMSVDARKSPPVFVVSVGVNLPENEKELAETLKNPDVIYREEYTYNPPVGNEPLSRPPVIVGFGPAGMLCALSLAAKGFRPIVLEQGGTVEERDKAIAEFIATGKLNTRSNIQFGEGGAGTYSDGKLTTRIGDPKCSHILKELVRLGAPEDILTKAKPHIGTDKLKKVVANLRREIEDLGSSVRFHTKVEDIIIKNGRVQAVVTDGGDTIETDIVVLATGHSSRDMYELLRKKNIELSAKPFSVGMRIEHLQADINKAFYGAYAGHPALPPAEYALSKRFGDRGVYSFCMCPGGTVVAAASEQDTVVTNGMSVYQRNGSNANAAIAVSVLPEDFSSDPFEGIRFQRELERRAFRLGGGNYKAPSQTAESFLAGTVKGADRVVPTYPFGTVTADLSKLFPANSCKLLKDGLAQFNRIVPGFCSGGALLTGVETRTSSPVRVLRNDELQSTNLLGLYPCGEGAGYAGGIMSAAVDGLRIAEKIIGTYKPE